MATTPPGWYDDGHGALRWWDGAQWTEHVAAPDPIAEGATAPTEADIVAANEAAAAAPQADETVPQGAGLAPQSGQPAEVDAATALGLGVPPAAATPAYPPYAQDQAQDAHPGGYPGADASAGAFVAATEPRKSKLWILWVVLGVVMLGIVIAAAIVIPLLFLNLAANGGSSEVPAGVAPSGADQEAAVAAVQLYDDAWQNADCDAFTASTTEDFRLSAGYEDCAAFEDAALNFGASVQDYVVTVTGITSDGGSIQVDTVETFDAVLDDEGAPLDPPQPQTFEYEYTVENVDGEWVIDVLAE